ncbi:arylsulfatase [Edaphobacter aggregans]|uniref:Arylsulfatase n=1 Tax=Edaphobacter aggregans TaxID=570835 RepID=A0A428MPS6_9BACT|nr:arylsulfatase [Edaphobacter aggregans]RSL18875.1 arylsulfatase [Edaphobacter aggregans]
MRIKGQIFTGSTLSGMAILVCLVATLGSLMPSVYAQENLPDRRPGTFAGKIGQSYKDSTPAWPITRKAPPNAPNVLVILLDDVGFGAASTFGGPIPTPALDRLAKTGLRYTRWNTTALCSPTRAALLSGRNHHQMGYGVIAEVSTGFPGYNSVFPDANATIAAILKDNGYNTAAFGKWHLTPDYETSAAGPFTQWPTGVGFERYYGFLGGDCNQWSPPLIDGTTFIEKPAGVKDYNLTADLANQTISWIRNQKSTAPNKPFFIYFAPGATHAPHQPPKQWVEKFKGQFEKGWNKVSEETYERMKTMGILPPTAKYNPIPDDVGVWDKLDPDTRTVYARMMEVYAGYLAYADYEAGRLLDTLDELGITDNTMVIYAVGDNGASAEGGLSGTLNEVAADFNAYRPNVVAEALRRLDEIGGPTTYNHYPAGWALAMNSPFKQAKRIASQFGGTANPMVISWPNGIKDHGGLRTQFAHAIDIAPTILDVAGIPQPKTVNGIPQTPMTGTSMAYTFLAENANAPSQHHTQYFELGGIRAIYHDGWIAATDHGFNAWEDRPRGNYTFDTDKWELYDLANDFTEHDDVSAQNPAKLKALQALFVQEAKKYNVFPLDDRSAERFSPEATGRPVGAIQGLTKVTYWPGVTRVPEGSAIDVKNKSFSITAEVTTPPNGADGVIITQGGLFAGWALIVENSKPVFIYNWLQEQITKVSSPVTLPQGKSVVKFQFSYDGGGVGKGGTGSLSIDDKQVASAHIEKTVPFRFSLDESLDVGEDTGTPVSMDYFDKMPFRFTGTLGGVTVEVAPVSAAQQKQAADAHRKVQQKMAELN